MQTLNSFRTSLGISQRQLAAFIGGDRTQLVRAEKGERNLSAEAAINFSALFPAWQVAMQEPVDSSGETSVEDAREWRWHALLCRKKAQQLQKQLADMKALYAAASRLKIFVIKVVKSQVSLTERQQRWLEERQYESHQLLEENNNARQKALRLKILALEAEANIYENAVEEI